MVPLLHLLHVSVHYAAARAHALRKHVWLTADMNSNAGAGASTSMGKALGLRLSVANAEDEAAERGVKVLGRAVWRREHMSRQPEADHTASPLRRQPTCNHSLHISPGNAVLAKQCWRCSSGNAVVVDGTTSTWPFRDVTFLIQDSKQKRAL